MGVESSIDNYSAGYYGVELVPMAYDDGPVVDSAMFDYIDKTLYRQTDAPVWMRAGFGGPYFQLTRGENMIHDLIGLPMAWIEDFDLDEGERSHFLICKPGNAHFLSRSVRLGHSFDDFGKYIDDDPMDEH